MYPIEKYKFIVTGNRVIALARDAGRTVRGVAICAESDTFDLEKGKALAAARCAEKIALRREKRAIDRYNDVLKAMESWRQLYVKASSDITVKKAVRVATQQHLEDILSKM